MNEPQKHIEVAISRGAFAHNVGWLRERLAPAKLCVVMKSDAYGHGLSELLDTAVEAGADYLRDLHQRRGGADQGKAPRPPR